MAEYRFRWTTTADVVVTVAADDEDAAYDLAATLAAERLSEVSTTINGVAVHADIDGLGADEITPISGDSA